MRRRGAPRASSESFDFGTQPADPASSPLAKASSPEELVKRMKGKTMASRRSKIGNQAEDFLQVHHDLCERLGVAALRRVPTPMRVTGSSARGLTAVYTRASTVDYLGWTMKAPARPLAVEAKHVTRAPGQPIRFPFRNLEPQQQRDLRAVHHAGGVALLVIVCEARLYPVPWSVVEPLLRARRPSMVVDEFLSVTPAYLAHLL